MENNYMVLAISGAALYIVFFAIVMIVFIVSVHRYSKKNMEFKKMQAEKFNDLNSFILKYEAEKSKREKDAAGDKTVEEGKEAPTISMEKKESDIPAETVVRVTALHEDAGMTAEQIAEKTGLAIEAINKIIEK